MYTDSGKLKEIHEEYLEWYKTSNIAYTFHSWLLIVKYPHKEGEDYINPYQLLADYTGIKDFEECKATCDELYN